MTAKRPWASHAVTLSLLQCHPERSEESPPARLRIERPPGVFNEAFALPREILLCFKQDAAAVQGGLQTQISFASSDRSSSFSLFFVATPLSGSICMSL